MASHITLAFTDAHSVAFDGLARSAPVKLVMREIYLVGGNLGTKLGLQQTRPTVRVKIRVRPEWLVEVLF